MFAKKVQFYANSISMKKLFIILAVVVSCSSCQSAWNQSDKDAFYEACIDDANTWSGDPAKSKQYCECVMVKVLERYPNVNYALENIETLSRDPEIKKCRIPILK
jgi:hypothetical protein